MASQTLDRILEAEKHATEKLESARRIAEQMISEANNDAKSIIDKAQKDVEIEMIALLAENKNKINAIFEESNQISVDEVIRIKADAKVREAKAVDMIVTRIIAGF